MSIQKWTVIALLLLAVGPASATTGPETSGFEVQGTLEVTSAPHRLATSEYRYTYAFVVQSAGEEWFIKVNLIDQRVDRQGTVTTMEDVKPNELIHREVYFDGTHTLETGRRHVDGPAQLILLRESEYPYCVKTAPNTLWLTYLSGKYIGKGRALPLVFRSSVGPRVFLGDAEITMDPDSQLPSQVLFRHMSAPQGAMREEFDKYVKMTLPGRGQSIPEQISQANRVYDDGDLLSRYEVLQMTNAPSGRLPSQFRLESYLAGSTTVKTRTLGNVTRIAPLPPGQVSTIDRKGLAVGVADYRFRSERHHMDSIVYTPGADEPLVRPIKDSELRRLFQDRKMSDRYYVPSKPRRAAALLGFLAVGIVVLIAARRIGLLPFKGIERKDR